MRSRYIRIEESGTRTCCSAVIVAWTRGHSPDRDGDSGHADE